MEITASQHYRLRSIQSCWWRAGRPRPAAMLLQQVSGNFILSPPLRNVVRFGITNRQRTSEQVSGLPAESSRWLLASNSVSLQLTPFRGSHSGTKFPEGFPRIAEPPSDL